MKPDFTSRRLLDSAHSPRSITASGGEKVNNSEWSEKVMNKLVAEYIF